MPCEAPVAAVAARCFQGVARTGRFSDPPRASKNGPRGQGRAPPPAPAWRTRAPPWPRPQRESSWAPHKISSPARLRSAQGQDLSRVGPLFGAPVWMPLHSLETILAPFRPHVPGISSYARAGPLNHWPSGRAVPRRHHSGALPASPSQCRRAATLLVSAVRSRSAPAVHSSGWRGRQEPGRQVAGLSEAPSLGPPLAPSPEAASPPGKVLKASAA